MTSSEFWHTWSDSIFEWKNTRNPPWWIQTKENEQGMQLNFEAMWTGKSLYLWNIVKVNIVVLFIKRLIEICEVDLSENSMLKACAFDLGQPSWFLVIEISVKHFYQTVFIFKWLSFQNPYSWVHQCVLHCKTWRFASEYLSFCKNLEFPKCTHGFVLLLWINLGNTLGKCIRWFLSI